MPREHDRSANESSLTPGDDDFDPREAAMDKESEAGPWRRKCLLNDPP
jgi:hypothetical protein